MGVRGGIGVGLGKACCSVADGEYRVAPWRVVSEFFDRPMKGER